MSLAEERIIGQQILADVDQLIETVFAAGLREQDEYKQEFESGCRLVMEIYSLLEQIIGQGSEYLEAAIKELVKQRIPDQKLLDGFVDFDALFERMCRHASGMLAESGSSSRHGGAGSEAARDNVERALDLLFPRAEIVRRPRYNGISFAYYLPVQKIAVDEGGSREKGRALKDLQCRREGIRMVSVDKSMSSFREIARHIQRQLDAGAW